MVEGLTLTSEPFVQKHPIDGLDARKAPVVVAKGIREAILGGTYEPGARMRETELAERFKVKSKLSLCSYGASCTSERSRPEPVGPESLRLREPRVSRGIRTGKSL